MNKFMRFCLIVFILASVLATGILTVLWFSWQPLAPYAEQLAGMEWFNIALLITLGVMAVGLIVMLIYTIASPGKVSNLSLKREDGTISITKDAIHSSVEHTLNSYKSFKTKDIKVDMRGKRNPQISVRAKLEPGTNSNLAQLGESLQQEVASDVSTLTGYPTSNVDITFAGNAIADNRNASKRNSVNSSTRKEVPHVGYKRQGQSVVNA